MARLASQQQMLLLEFVFRGSWWGLDDGSINVHQIFGLAKFHEFRYQNSNQKIAIEQSPLRGIFISIDVRLLRIR
jgi:hypothetical protein